MKHVRHIYGSKNTDGRTSENVHEEGLTDVLFILIFKMIEITYENSHQILILLFIFDRLRSVSNGISKRNCYSWNVNAVNQLSLKYSSLHQP